MGAGTYEAVYALATSVAAVPDDLAVPRLAAVAAGLTFVGAGAGGFFLGLSSSSWPHMRTANETTQTETTTMQSPRNHDDEPRAADAAALAADARILAMEVEQREQKKVNNSALDAGRDRYSALQLQSPLI